MNFRMDICMMKFMNSTRFVMMKSSLFTLKSRREVFIILFFADSISTHLHFVNENLFKCERDKLQNGR